MSSCLVDLLTALEYVKALKSCEMQKNVKIKVPGSPKEFHSPLVPGDPKVCPDCKRAQVPSGGSPPGPSDPTVQVLQGG